MAFYCNGKKDMCSCDILCADCEHYDNTGGVKITTNADCIRSMSDEDLGDWIAGMSTICECCAELNECESPRGFNRCSHGVKDWLKQPSE